MDFRKRIEALEERIKPDERDLRVILAWVDDQGRLTKAADTHPHLPDPQEYYLDITKLSPADESSETENNTQTGENDLES